MVQTLPRAEVRGAGFLVVSFAKDWLDCLQCCLSRLDELPHFASRMLTKWFYPTRLETRTKESNMCASMWVANRYAQ